MEDCGARAECGRTLIRRPNLRGGSSENH